MSNDKKVCTFIRKRPAISIRKRKSSSESDGDTEIIKSDHKVNFNPLVQGTSKYRRLQKPSNDDSNSDEEIITTDLAYKSSAEQNPQGPRDMGATSTLEIDTETDRDAVAIAERAKQLAQEEKDSRNSNNEEDNSGISIYKGLNNYSGSDAKFRGNKFSARGPIRAPNNVRVTVRWDYAPDICKDYKETGFCGFGDSCKFLHDRGDYKHGWQLEREERAGGPGGMDDDERCYEISSDEDDLPFKCIICRRSFENPVVTRCKHYFCEKCALARYRKSARCYVCGTDTKGTFNPAKELEKRLKEGGIQEDSDVENDAENSGQVEDPLASVPTLPDDDDDDDDDESSEDTDG